MKYALSDRTEEFSVTLIKTLKQVKISVFNKNIIEQLLKSGTSIGANYQEANGAVSKNDFKNKIALCKKEALETKYWLKVLEKTDEENRINFKPIAQEVLEFVLMFGKILKSCS